MQPRRWVTGTVTALVAVGLLTLPSAAAATRHPAGPAPGAGTVGRIAFLTRHQAVKIATVAADGHTSAITTVGPVTKLKPGQTIQIFDLVGSGAGGWLAWQEQILRRTSGQPRFVRTVLVLRNVASSKVVHLTTAQAPVGFAGDLLVTSNADVTKTLRLHPTPHLVKVPSSQFPLGTYRGGVVDTVNRRAPRGPSQTWQLQLTSLSGAHRLLHSYVLGPTNYRTPDAAWSSADGRHLVIERGNHQDFGGLGPSSLADEFRLSGPHARTRLGHFGTAKAMWRIARVSYAGASDRVWAVWERGTRTGASSVVATHERGHWVRIRNRGIAVAGNAAGWVVIQPGRYVSVGRDVPAFDAVPTSNAVLRHGGRTVSLGVEGSVFLWVAT